MKNVATTVLLLAIALLLVAPAAAADKEQKKGKKKPGKGRPAVNLLKQFEKAELTEEQHAKVKDLAAEYGPKITAAIEKAGLSPEQRKARAEALKKAKDDGKKGKELQQAVAAAVELSADQQAAQKDAQSIRAEFRKAVLGLLTAEQKAKLGVKGRKGKKPAAKKAAGEKKPKKEAAK